MSRTNQITLWLITLIFSLLTAACATAASQNQTTYAQEAIGAQVGDLQTTTLSSATSNDRSAAAAALLASIVRLEIHGAGISHGTVMNGRFLVTHNHFPFDMTAISPSYPADFSAFSLYRTDGSPLIDKSPLTNLNVVIAEAEMLVLDFGTFGDQGFFDFLGIPSAQFSEAAGLTAGMEVAQLNWNEETAWIEWVTVRMVDKQNGIPALILDSALTAGASGGGLFWNGWHIGNNWSNNVVKDEATGEVVDTYSVAAPNSDFFRSPVLVQATSTADLETEFPATAEEMEEVVFERGGG